MTRRLRLQLVACGPAKVLEPAGGLAGRLGRGARGGQSPPRSPPPAARCAPGRRRKSTRLASHHAISSSRQKPLSARSRMRTRGQRARIWPTMRVDLLDRAGGGIDVGAPQLRRQQMAAAEDVQRQIAVAVVVAVEEAAFLMAVQRIVGGIEVERDLRRRPWHGRRGTDRRTAPRWRRYRRRSCRSGSVRPGCSSRRFSVLLPASGAQSVRPAVELAGQHRHHRIMAQFVVVVEVFVAQRNADNALRHQCLRHVCSTKARIAAVLEAGGEAAGQPDDAIGRTQQQRARVRRDATAVKRGNDRTAFDRCKIEQLPILLKARRASLCQNRGAF